MLKGLHFPKCIFQKARRGGRASWGWISLITERGVLKQEGIWTIGMGEEIRVYTESWVYSKTGFRVEGGPRDNVNVELRVSNLIGPGRRWDENKVRGAITNEDAEHILSILIPHNRMKYQLIWTHSKDGTPQAKFVYHQMREIQNTI